MDVCLDVCLDGCWLTPQLDKVIVLQPVDGLELAADVELLGGVEEVPHSRMLFITPKDFLRFQSPV